VSRRVARKRARSSSEKVRFTLHSAAIGARVTVRATIDGAEVVQTREVGGGHGHFGMQDDLVQTLGLGDACEATVTVRWPDGRTSQHTLAVDRAWRIPRDAAPTALP
jgi:hypothetical protein